MVDLLRTHKNSLVLVSKRVGTVLVVQLLQFDTTT